MKVIKINKDGLIKVKEIDPENLYNQYDFYAPLTYKKYPLSVAVKENSLYNNEQPNHTANNLFKRNDFYGDIYIILENPDEYDSDAEASENEASAENETNKADLTFENLLLDIYNNNLVY